MPADTLIESPQATAGGIRRSPLWQRRMPAWLQAGRPVLLPLSVLAASIAALLPLEAAVNGGWIVGAALFGALILAVGTALRLLRVPGWLVPLGELTLWAFAVTALFLSDTAMFVIVPTTASVDQASALVAGAIDQLQTSAPPVAADPSTTAVFIATAGLIVWLADLLACGIRMPVLALAPLIAVAVAPAIPVSNSFSVLTFAAFAVAALWMLRVSVALRSPAAPGTGTATVALGGIAVVVAIAIAPLIPAPAPIAKTPGTGTVSIDGSLNLGTDLRLPSNVQVLTVTTSAAAAPYLRVATLSTFTGTIWTPDSPNGVTPVRDSTAQQSDALQNPGADGATANFAPITVASGIPLQKVTTHVTVDRLRTTYLPVPYPAVSLQGATDGWGYVPGNRTIIGFGNETSPGVSYTVTAQIPEPTLEQIDAASATVGVPRDDGVPASTPTIVKQLAEQVTASSPTDYDKLEALQTWFRGSQFTYSLKSPVTHGFDSSGVDAVAQFLKVKSGYCVHFASAFALMARELGMTSRIVIGFLPGTATDKTQNGAAIYSVTSSELHAWPEVYFSGIGWVPFEPTKSLGTPTVFAPTVSSGPGQSGASQSQTPTPHASQSPVNGGRNSRLAQDTVGGSAKPVAQSFAWWGVALLVLLVLAVPGLVGFARRRREDAAIRDGDPVATWTSVLRLAVDLRIPLPPGESPRMLGDRLVHEYGAAAEDVDALVTDIERASYAPERLRWAWSDASLPEHVTAVRRALRAAAPRGRRVSAVLFPRSLVVRPGSAAAASFASSDTR
jgi:transglutaminase-like putative cysteine protease